MKILDMVSRFEKLALNTPAFRGNELDREMNDEELARAIRLDMESELDAINLYENHLKATRNQKAIETLKHVIKEEKEHFKLFNDLLKELDPEQEEISSEKDSEL